MIEDTMCTLFFINERRSTFAESLFCSDEWNKWTEELDAIDTGKQSLEYKENKQILL